MHSVFLPLDGVRHSAHSAITIESSKARVDPVPRDQWPFWARVVEIWFRRPHDIGLGDSVVHWIGDARSDRFKKWFHRKFGKRCGCTERQRWLNRRFPYSHS